jgi:hypothetical protein
MSGHTLTFTATDIQLMATAYSEELRSAPLVLGHPETDSPSHGVVKSLEAKNGELFAFAEVSDALVAMVKRREYLSVSCYFIGPERADNPRPGAWYLKHLGFLGAMKPGVKDLGPLSFAEPLMMGQALNPINGFIRGMGSTVSFSECVNGRPPVQNNRDALHQAAQNVVSENAGFSYVEAVRMLEKKFT